MAIATSIDSSIAAAPPTIEDPQDLLGRVRRRGDRIRAEDRQRLLLVEPLLDLGLAGERPAEDDRASTRQRTAGRGPRERRGLARDELAGTGVAEVRRVRTLDPDAPIAGLATGERATTADHGCRRSRPEREGQRHRHAARRRSRVRQPERGRGRSGRDRRRPQVRRGGRARPCLSQRVRSRRRCGARSSSNGSVLWRGSTMRSRRGPCVHARPGPKKERASVGASDPQHLAQ